MHAALLQMQPHFGANTSHRGAIPCGVDFSSLATGWRLPRPFVRQMHGRRGQFSPLSALQPEAHRRGTSGEDVAALAHVGNRTSDGGGAKLVSIGFHARA